MQLQLGLKLELRDSPRRAGPLLITVYFHFLDFRVYNVYSYMCNAICNFYIRFFFFLFSFFIFIFIFMSHMSHVTYLSSVSYFMMAMSLQVLQAPSPGPQAPTPSISSMEMLYYPVYLYLLNSRWYCRYMVYGMYIYIYIYVYVNLRCTRRLLGLRLVV